MFHPLPYAGSLPEKFTYPFCYQPHPSAVMAAEIVQKYLSSKEEWADELNNGKMFGVMVVTDATCRQCSTRRTKTSISRQRKEG